MSLLFSIVRPFLFQLEPEIAHNLTIAALKSGLVPAMRARPEKAVKIGSLTLRNGCGLAAGFDKNAVAADALLKLGFGFVEVGGVTPRPQPGNPRPRVFRLTEDRAVINRYGLNSDGADAVARNLEKRKNRSAPVGINLGANKESDDRTADYAECLKVLGGLADFATVNVSSPNTPGLRTLQDPAELTAIFDRLNAAKSSAGYSIPLWLKIAPDLEPEDRQAIAECLPDLGIEAVVIANTTIDRPQSLQSQHRAETGGLSGAPLTNRSTELVRDMHQRTNGTIPIIGVGGIMCGQDASDKIAAGASAVQIYSGMVYRGPDLIGEIIDALNTGQVS